MAKNLAKKLDAIVRKKEKITIKAASLALKAKEEDINRAAMKLSDEFSVTKKGGKLSEIIYTKKPNAKEVLAELVKISKKLDDKEFNETKKAIVSIIKKLEKTQYLENLEKSKKELSGYSKDLDSFLKTYFEFKSLEKKSGEYSESVKQASKKIDEDTKKMQEESKLLNLTLEAMRKSYDELKKKRNDNFLSTQKLKEVMTEGKKKQKSIAEMLGLKKLMPEKKQAIKKPAKESHDKKEENLAGQGFEAEKEEAPKKDSQIAKVTGKFSTEIDQLLKLVKEEKKVSFAKLAKLYEEKTETIEEWCEALEDIGLVSIHYPLIGSPYITYKKGENDEKSGKN